MNICLVSTGYPPEDGGGIGTYIFNLAQGLNKLGHNIFVITQTRSGSVDKEEDRDGIRVFTGANKYLPVIDSLLPNMGWSMYVSKKIKEIDKKYSIDIVEFPNWEGVGFWYLLQKPRKPVVTRIHTPYFETLSLDKDKRNIRVGDRFTCWMEKQTCLRGDAIVSSTKHHAAFMAKEYGLSDDEINIIPLGIELSESDIKYEKSKDSNKNLVLYVSRLENRKGTLDLIHAIPLVIDQHPTTEFVFIGSDRPHAPGNLKFEQYFKLRYSEYTNNVKFLGFVSNETLVSYYKKADIFAVPSVYESFGLIYVEAMSFGLPVIAGTGGGIPEVVSDAVTGFLVPPSNKECLAKKINCLIGDPSLRKKMGMESLRITREFFSRERMAEKMSEMYKNVINKH